MQLPISLSCSFCSHSLKTECTVPDGWALYAEMIELDEAVFCPEHSPIKPFADSQCPGCVGGWGDCDLWKAFAYRCCTLTRMDRSSLEHGICPKRTNGSFLFSPSEGIQEVRMDDAPVAAAGQALLNAIDVYHEKHHTKTECQEATT